jgi:hypothetical protein
MPAVTMASMIVIMRMRIIMVVIPRAIIPVIGRTEIKGRPIIRGGIIG